MAQVTGCWNQDSRMKSLSLRYGSEDVSHQKLALHYLTGFGFVFFKNMSFQYLSESYSLASCSTASHGTSSTAGCFLGLKDHLSACCRANPSSCNESAQTSDSD